MSLNRIEWLEAHLQGAVPAGRLEGIDDPETRLSLEKAFLRGWKGRLLLITDAGGALPREHLAHFLGCSEKVIEAWTEAGEILALPIEGESTLYPIAQFRQGSPLPGLREALAACNSESPWTTLGVLLAPDDSLGGHSPLQALREGRLQEARISMSLWGEHGA